MQGNIALRYGQLISKLWGNVRGPLAPFELRVRFYLFLIIVRDLTDCFRGQLQNLVHHVLLIFNSTILKNFFHFYLMVYMKILIVFMKNLMLNLKIVMIDQMKM
jgi:hypothetical protein